MTDSLDRLKIALADRYAIERELGEGGMATVYLAEDIKHQRKVAIKLLKPELAAVLGGERFVQEITTTAALQHPHILPLFDSGTADGFLYYVMPFIDGETLRDKLDRETQLGIDQAVQIAREVADALHYAHRHGVIHRDIKPENILMHDGRPMVADFGIALAVSAAAGGRMTETGLSLGTPHYMSPEQATAEKEIDARSDVYSVGSVLYEMLTGNPPHVGSSAQQIIMRIVTEDAVPVTKVRRAVPTNVAAAVGKSIEKLPADRFESAKEFGDALANPGFTTAAVAQAGFAATTSGSRGMVIGLGAGLAVMTVIAGWALTRPGPTQPVGRYALALPAGQEADPSGYAAISSDGSTIVYLGPSTTGVGTTQLWVKRRAELSASAIPGTEAANAVAFSPDDQWLAVLHGGRLVKQPLSGGASVELTTGVSNNRGSVVWQDDGSIVFLRRSDSEIMRIADSGGVPERIWESDSLAVSNLTALPDSRGLLFQACSRPCNSSDVWVLDYTSGEAQILIPGSWGGVYLSTGHLVHVRDDNAGMAVPFDLGSLELTGESRQVFDVVSNATAINPYLAVSASGDVVMQANADVDQLTFELIWVDRAGNETAVDSNWAIRNTQFAGNFGWSISPDGSSVAIGVNTPTGDDVWIKPLSRAAASRVTFGRGSENRPTWAPGGQSVLFISDSGISMSRADGSGQDSLILEGVFDEAVFSPGGEWLLFRQGARSSASGFRDIFGMKIGVDSAPVPILATQFDEMAIRLSPDGRWLAYQSDETGVVEVFVRPFPNTADGKWPVSSGGGTAPLWSRDGTELFYLSDDDDIMAVSVDPGPPFRLGDPEFLFHRRPAIATLDARFYTPWDVAADGRFLMQRTFEGDDVVESPLIVVENWFTELREIMNQ